MPKISELPAANAPDGTESLAIVQSAATKKTDVQSLIDATLNAHNAEAFPHDAAKIESDSTVGQGDVEADLDWLHANTPGNAAVVDLDTRLDRYDDMLGGGLVGAGSVTTGNTGRGTRFHYVEDFYGSKDAAVSGSIGLTGWLKGGGTTALGTVTSAHPGVINHATGTSANTYCYLMAPGRMLFGASWFDLAMWVRPVTLDSATTFRCGLSSDPTSETPTDGVFAEHLAGDTAFWRNVTRITSTETRATSALSTTSNQWYRIRIRRTSLTEVTFTYTKTSAGVPGAETADEVVTFSPAVTLYPFMAVKNTTTTSKSADIDCCDVIVTDLLR